MYLIFDIDTDLNALIHGLPLKPHDVTAAYNRALQRTAVTMRAQSMRVLRDTMQTRGLKTLRKRLRDFRLTGEMGTQELKLWYGLNDLPVSVLKGRKRRLGTRRRPRGAEFVPSGKVPIQRYSDGFIARLYGRRSIWARKGMKTYPVVEGRAPVSDAAQIAIEDDVLDKLPDVFLHHFQSEINARSKGHVTTWRK